MYAVVLQFLLAIQPLSCYNTISHASLTHPTPPEKGTPRFLLFRGHVLGSKQQYLCLHTPCLLRN